MLKVLSTRLQAVTSIDSVGATMIGQATTIPGPAAGHFSLLASDGDVLVDREDKGGLRNYFLSMDFSGECLGQHLGSDQQANLGDGRGAVNETAVMRYNYKDPYVGTCRETIEGGNHFRYWVQKSTKAVFMAASVELPIELGHDIVRNGYNLGRDWIVGNLTGTRVVSFNFEPDIPAARGIPDSVKSLSASSVAATNTVPPTSFVPNITFPLSTIVPTDTASTPVVVAISESASSTATVPIAIPTASLTFSTPTPTPSPVGSSPTFTGRSSYGGYTYETTATYVAGLISNSSEGINHPITVEENGRPAQDGLVAVFGGQDCFASRGERCLAQHAVAHSFHYIASWLCFSLVCIRHDF
ncbi:hypothetical protein OPQ81_011430 [Rhizoctonia solani]|nr:hypothetical protein OPQ81_011430 [Rhizoctonia solani]